jgi:hypothetical protein
MNAHPAKCLTVSDVQPFLFLHNPVHPSGAYRSALLDLAVAVEARANRLPLHGTIPINRPSMRFVKVVTRSWTEWHHFCFTRLTLALHIARLVHENVPAERFCSVPARIVVGDEVKLVETMGVCLRTRRKCHSHDHGLGIQTKHKTPWPHKDLSGRRAETVLSVNSNPSYKSGSSIFLLNNRIHRQNT